MERRELLGLALIAPAAQAPAPDPVAKAQALGRDYIVKYRNCAQGVIAALQDALDFVPKSEQVFQAAACLHGGATKTRLASCGCFTGAGMVIGELCGRPREQTAAGTAANKPATALMLELAGRFEQAYGSVICKDVREKVAANCREVTAQAAGWAAEALVRQFAK